MTQADFDRRLYKLLQQAASDGLCGGCVVMRLLSAATVIIDAVDDETIMGKHGVSAMFLPAHDTNPCSDDTRH